MITRELRRIRDRKFIPFIWEKHWLRAFSIIWSPWAKFDLFPPVSGYKAWTKTRRSYHVNLRPQIASWSKAVRERDKYTCQYCGSEEKLEAHHVWPQGGFVHLRYVVRNGITLCRSCHMTAVSNMEITPRQFKWVSKDCEVINSNIESGEFWEEYLGQFEWFRLKLFNLEPDYPITPRFDMDEKELAEWALNNVKLSAVNKSASNSFCPDTKVKLNDKLVTRIKKYQKSEKPWLDYF